MMAHATSIMWTTWLSIIIIGCSLSLHQIGAEATPSVDSSVNSWTHQRVPKGDLFAELQFNPIMNQVEAMLTIRPYTKSDTNSTKPTAHDCQQCTTQAALHFYRTARWSIDQMCRLNDLDPTRKNHCHWINSHLKEWMGYLIARLQPFSGGLSYCIGGGFCHLDQEIEPLDHLTFREQTTAVEDTETQLFRQLSTSYSFVERIGVESSPPKQTDQVSLDTIENALASNLAMIHAITALDVTKFATPTEKCHACLEHSVRWVMRRAIRQLKYHCRTQLDDAPFQSWCTWASQHRPHILGMIYALVEPYQVASGWCLGKEMCSYQKIQSDLLSLPFTMSGRLIHDRLIKPGETIAHSYVIDPVRDYEPQTRKKFYP